MRGLIIGIVALIAGTGFSLLAAYIHHFHNADWRFEPIFVWSCVFACVGVGIGMGSLITSVPFNDK